jgi:hypothetical protein
MFKSDIPCKDCKKSFFIQNKNKHLCSDCVFKRNHEGKSKADVYRERCSNNFEKALERKKRDERWYKYLHDILPNKCNECGKPLNKKFRENGKILNKWQYSHIYSKGAYPKYRWHKANGERLCFSCHQRWDFGDRENMKIFQKNKDLIVVLRNNSENLII